MPRLRPHLPLLLGVLASLSLHAFILLPGLIAMMTGGTLYSMTARFPPDEISPPEDAPEESPDLTLGLENGSPSTLTWIGYEEYQKHHAPPDHMEQAAFDSSPASPAPRLLPSPPIPSATPPPLQPKSEPAEPSDPQESPETPPSPGTSKSPPPPNSPLLPSPVKPTPTKTETKSIPLPPEQPPALTPPTPSSPPPTPPAPPGDPSDRESDPSSIVEVPLDQMRIGKPLAARGLEIRTRRPDFTNLQRLTALPRNPLYEIAFDRTGKPRRVKTLEPAGDKGIDAAVKASLYRWRATGKPLQKLKKSKTLKFKIRIMLSRGH